nr:hypothetical protein [Catenulispora rubra]
MTTTATASPAISVSDLRKSFGEKSVLNGVDLSVPAGTVFALRRPGRARAAELLERFGLTDAADQPPSTYSGGMRRRLIRLHDLVGRRLQDS